GLYAGSNPLPGSEITRTPSPRAVEAEAVPASTAGSIINVPQDYSAIQAAFDAAADGDTILVAPGIYPEAINMAAKSVVLASWFLTTHDTSYISQTILDGQSGRAVITIAGSVGPATMISGFTIQNADDGISPRAKFNILNCRIISCSDGIDYEAGSGGLCKFNLFENNSDDGIDLDYDVDIVIDGNTIRNNDDDGIEIRLHPYRGPLLKYVIRNNEIYGNGADGIQLIGYDTLSDRIFFIEGNLIYNNRKAGLGCMSGGHSSENFEGASIPERIFLFNNTFSANAYGVTGGDSLVALNNIFVGHMALAMKNVDAGSIVAYGIYWNNGANFENCNVDSASILGSDPLLDARLHLQPASPAIDAGIAFFDWHGETVLNRPSSSYNGMAPDLGAFEFGGASTPSLAIDDVIVTEGNAGTVN
ncbi:MAG: right-handed parallel beta-helix repeat-containing protein, partial [Anaerolineae bacterium]|nr:right-handed parallel beta-helix repeat-containing protein [Anaerolineae bacterium]